MVSRTLLGDLRFVLIISEPVPTLVNSFPTFVKSAMLFSLKNNERTKITKDMVPEGFTLALL